MERLISVLENGDLRIEDQSALPKPAYWRVPHDIERVNVNKNNFEYITGTQVRGFVRDVVIERNKSLPEVYRLNPVHNVELTEPLQRLWKNINPELSGQRWSTLLGYDVAWCNDTGFNDPTDPRANYITGENLKYPNPQLDQTRFCGGAFFKGGVSGGYLFPETIPASNPPSAQYVLNNPHLWYWGTSVSPKGYVYYIRRVGTDGTMKRVRIPIITTKTVYISLKELHRLPDGFTPEATWTHYLL